MKKLNFHNTKDITNFSFFQKSKVISLFSKKTKLQLILQLTPRLKLKEEQKYAHKCKFHQLFTTKLNFVNMLFGITILTYTKTTTNFKFHQN